jgi:septum site-determining protein MinD
VIQGDASLNQALIQDKHVTNGKLFILAASQTKDKDALVKEGVRKVINELKQMGFEYIICDSPAGIEQGALMALYFADEAIVVTNPEISSVRDSDRIIGILSAKSERAEKHEEPIKEHLLITRYDPERVSADKMLSYEDVFEILKVPVLGVIPESKDVIEASNNGVSVILYPESRAGLAYSDTVERLTQNPDLPLRFTTVEKKGILSRLFSKNKG